MLLRSTSCYLLPTKVPVIWPLTTSSLPFSVVLLCHFPHWCTIFDTLALLFLKQIPFLLDPKTCNCCSPSWNALPLGLHGLLPRLIVWHFLWYIELHQCCYNHTVKSPTHPPFFPPLKRTLSLRTLLPYQSKFPRFSQKAGKR